MGKKLKENFRFDGSRYGFLGQGFGKPNSYNPFKTLSEEEDKPDPIEDVWAGGENLVEPKEYVDVYHGLEAPKRPESLNITMTESKLRKIIRSVLKESM
tara:strand:+ start:207 stop:503 length:297 start_codon:yes stop_codon:yes gene_type:complete